METEIQTPGEQDFAGDDRVLPFEVDGLDVRGRTVQLGPMIDAILAGMLILSRLRVCSPKPSRLQCCSAPRSSSKAS